MNVIPPLSITPAMLTSSTATEPWAPAAYNSGTTYALGDVVLVAADFAIYQSLAAGNVGNTPNISPSLWQNVGATETAYNAGTTYALGNVVSSVHRLYSSLQNANTGNTPLISPTWWLDIGATNEWRALDLLRNTQTTFASPLTYVITPGVRVNSLAALGMVADNVSFSVTSVTGGGTVYTYSLNLSTRRVLDWYMYFFEPFSTRPSAVKFDIPPYTDAIITVTMTRSSGNVRCGSLVIGTYVALGTAQLSAESDTLNFSTVTRDAYGNATLVQRRSVPKTNQSVVCDKADVNKILDTRDYLDALPALWSWLDDLTDDYAEAGVILGVYKKFSINATHPNKATIALELEEV